MASHYRNKSSNLTAFHLTSPYFTLTLLHSLHFTSPHFTSLHPTSPHFTSLRLTSPHLTSMSHFGLTNETLIDLLDCELKRYSEEYVPLPRSKVDRIAKCCNAVALARSSIGRNPRKRRAHDILNDLWATFPEVFVLCASTVYVWHLGSLKSTDYLIAIKAWWKLAHHPAGLAKTVTQLNILKTLPLRQLEGCSVSTTPLLESAGVTQDLAACTNPVEIPLKTCPFSDYNDEQWTLFHLDPRGKWLRSQYEKASRYEDEVDESFLNIESRKALTLLRIARPGKAVHPGCSCATDRGEYLVMTEEEYFYWAQNLVDPQLVVIRDRRYIERSGEPYSGQQLLDDIGRLPQKSTIAIQDWSKKPRACSRNVRTGEEQLACCISAENLPISEVLQRWESTNFTSLHPPLNLLNIQEFRPRYPPSGFTRYFNFLDRAANYSAITTKLAVDPESTTIGKSSLRVAGNDISACRRFSILAQGGMFSSFHMDHLGVWTGCTLEPTMHDASHARFISPPGRPPINTSPLKYWLFVSFKDCSEDEITHEMQRFASYGGDYVPSPPARLIAVSLVEGDTIIMPPGTIHAPVTVTDCFFRGFTGVHPEYIDSTIRTWDWLIKNPDCTNEVPSHETRRILEFYIRNVLANPLSHGVPDIDSFLAKCRSFGVSSFSCRRSCTSRRSSIKGRKAACSCQMIGIPCADDCPTEEEHRRAVTSNIFGRWPKDLKLLQYSSI